MDAWNMLISTLQLKIGSMISSLRFWTAMYLYRIYIDHRIDDNCRVDRGYWYRTSEQSSDTNLVANDDDAEKGNCSIDMPRLRNKKLQIKIPRLFF